MKIRLLPSLFLILLFACSTSEETTKHEIIKPENKNKSINEELVVNIPTDRLPENLNPEVGMKLQMKTKDDQIVVVTIVGITEDALTVDANHELADKDLHFDIELVEIL